MFFLNKAEGQRGTPHTKFGPICIALSNSCTKNQVIPTVSFVNIEELKLKTKSFYMQIDFNFRKDVLKLAPLAYVSYFN